MVEYLQGWQHRRDELGSDICVGGELPVAVASGGPGMPCHLFIIHSLTTGYAHPPSSILSCFTCLQILSWCVRQAKQLSPEAQISLATNALGPRGARWRAVPLAEE